MKRKFAFLSSFFICETNGKKNYGKTITKKIFGINFEFSFVLWGIEGFISEIHCPSYITS